MADQEDLPGSPSGPGTGRPIRRKKPKGGKEGQDANRKRQAEIRAFTRHVAADRCTVCRHPERDEVEQAYKDWHGNRSIAREFTLNEDHLKAHARVFEWDKQRGENMDRLYAVIMNELGAHFDPSKLSQKDLINVLTKMGRHIDRLQGRIVDRHQVDQRKTVTFIQIPLAGGSAPILPASKQKVLASGPALEAEFEPDDNGKATESFTDPRVGLPAEETVRKGPRSLGPATEAD